MRHQDADCNVGLVCVPDTDSPTGGWVHYTGEGNRPFEGPLGPCTPETETEQGPAQPQVTEPLVRRALRRIALPASEVVVQPPGGRTLVNFDTLFRTEPRRLVRTVRLLGRRVDLEIWPVAYRWRHGDGTEQVSERPGRVYEEGVPMSAYVSHRYSDAGVTVQPRVDTTYAARFRVDGGVWQDVLGTVTIPGAGSALRVVEGRPALVAAD